MINDQDQFESLLTIILYLTFNRRGIPAQPILNGYCGDYEWDLEITNKYDKDFIQNKSNNVFDKWLIIYMISFQMILLNRIFYNQ